MLLAGPLLLPLLHIGEKRREPAFEAYYSVYLGWIYAAVLSKIDGDVIPDHYGPQTPLYRRTAPYPDDQGIHSPFTECAYGDVEKLSHYLRGLILLEKDDLERVSLAALGPPHYVVVIRLRYGATERHHLRILVDLGLPSVCGT